MEEAVLIAQLRDKAQKAKAVRRGNLIPAEYYGKGIENQSLQLDYQTFRRLYRTAGENTIINLKVEGGKDAKVLVHSVDYHPVTDEFTHVDFIHVNMDEEVTTHVNVRLEGLAPAVKELGGTLIQNLDEVEIKCLPADLIHEVVVNVDTLVDFHSAIHVSDIQLSDKHTMVTDQKITIATVQAPREAEVDTEAPEATGEVPTVGGDEAAE